MRRLLPLVLFVGASFFSQSAYSQAAPPDRPSAGVERFEDGSVRWSNISLDGALSLAENWIADGNPVLALQLLAQLEQTWPHDTRIVFLQGLAARTTGDARGAVALFRRVLDSESKAIRARFELAKAYLELAEWDKAAFQFRFILAADVPPAIRREVRLYLYEIQDRRSWTFGFEGALAPSTNVNVAPSSAVIDPVFGGDEGARLTEDSTAQSGVGLRLAAAATRHFTLTQFDSPQRRVRMHVGVSLLSADYGGADFDDLSASLNVGLRVRLGDTTISGESALQRRWYANETYEDITAAILTLERRIVSQLSLRMQVTRAERDNARVATLDGSYTRANLRFSLQTTATSFITLEGAASRFDTSEESTSFEDASVELAAYRDFANGVSIEIAPSVSRQSYDGRDFVFGQTRVDERLSIGTTFIKRDRPIFGMAPFVRYSFTDNSSTLRLHDFERHAAEVGLAGVF